jgi:hypothetical protein
LQKGFFRFCKGEKPRRAAWLESVETFPLKGRKFPLT